MTQLGGHARRPPTRKWAAKRLGLTAVSTTPASALSIFPPGRAVCPGWERSSFERVVKSTRNSPPARSYNRTSTAASFEMGTSRSAFLKKKKGVGRESGSKVQFKKGKLEPAKSKRSAGPELYKLNENTTYALEDSGE